MRLVWPGIQSGFILERYRKVMEKQNYNQVDKRINILIAVAGVAIIVGLAGLVIGLMRPAASPSSSTPAGSLDAGSSYQEVINNSPDGEGTPKRGSSNN